MAVGAVVLAWTPSARAQLVERVAEPGAAAASMTRDAAGIATVRATRITGESSLSTAG